MSIAENSPIRASERSSSSRAQRQRRRFAEEAEVVGLQDLVEVEVLELGGHARVDHLHHLVGGDPVGQHRGDEGAGAGADVDVEVVDRAVDREQVERAQGADLVDAAGEAAAAEDQRGLRGLFAPLCRVRGFGLDVYDFAHDVQYSRAEVGLDRYLPPLACWKPDETHPAAAFGRSQQAFSCSWRAPPRRAPACDQMRCLAAPGRRQRQRAARRRRRNRPGRLRQRARPAAARWPRT